MKVKEILKGCSKWHPGSDYGLKKPTVSVLLPTFRRAQSGFFSASVRSVLEQSFQDLELIIIDDASTDGTEALISDFMKEDPRVSCIRHTFNVGLPAVSEYEGYMKARGKYIAFIFDDNVWQKDALKETIDLMNEKDLKATYGISRLFYKEGDEEKFLYIGDYTTLNTSELYCDNYMANASVVLHRDVLETVGLYDPHLSLTRLCDWDLWRRVADRFDFYGSGIFFTDEHGAKLKDSLGNSFKMDLWAAEERMQYSRNQELLPENYEEVDILDCFGSRSEFFLDCMCEYAEQYSKKRWFNKKDLSLIAIQKKNRINREIKRVVVLSSDFSASVTLYFDRIFKKAEHVIKYCKTTTYYTGYLALADCIIVERNLYAAQPTLKLAKEANIPCYYFVDDNFQILAGDDSVNNDLALMARLTTKENLAEYQGVLLSTDALLQFFKEKELHDNLIPLTPSIDTENIYPFHKAGKKAISIAFLGGGFRNGVLRTCVLPAMKRLSEEYDIVFSYPEGSMDKSEMPENSRLHFNPIPRDLSLNRTINRYAKKNVDIQIHCGPEILNNVYKTKNALLNATQLGAVLVVSDVEPYNQYQGDEGTYLLAENTEEDWYRILKKVAADNVLRKNTYTTALKYCLRYHAGTTTAEALGRELCRSQSMNYYRLNKQYESMYLQLFKSTIQAPATQAQAVMPVAPVMLPRAIESDKLCPSRELDRERTYTAICSSKDVSQIGVIFTCMGSAAGTVTICVSMKGCFLRESSLSISDVKNNEWTYFSVNPLYGCGGKELEITISAQYEEASDRLLVYEDIRNRSFWYRVINKFGFNFKTGRDILYTDFRG